MPSRVIHIRLDDWVLLGCHDIVKAGGKSTDNLPLSTITRDVLTALVRKMQQGDQIPFYNQEQVIDRMEELYAGELDIDIPFDVSELFDGTISEETEEEVETDAARIAKMAASIIAEEGEPSIGADSTVNISDKVKEIPERETIDIFAQDSLEFSEVKMQSPKDRFIEQAVETNDDVFKKAVCICYTHLGKDMWGSVTAEQIIMDLVTSHNAK